MYLILFQQPALGQALVDILHRRLAAEGRQRIAAEFKEARKEFAKGGCQPATLDEIIQEIQL